MVSVSRLHIYCVENNFIMTPTHLDNPDEGHEKKDGHEIIKLSFISPGGFLCDGSQVSDVKVKFIKKLSGVINPKPSHAVNTSWSSVFICICHILRSTSCLCLFPPLSSCSSVLHFICFHPVSMFLCLLPMFYWFVLCFWSLLWFCCQTYWLPFVLDFGNPSNSWWDMSFKTKHVNHVLAPAVKSTTRVIRIHCLGTMTVWKKKAGNPSNCSWEISVWTKVVEQQMDCLILASTKPGMAKNVVCEHNPGNYISDHNLIGKISITETENHIIKKEANYNWCS